LPQRIATYQDFKKQIVEVDFAEFMSNRGDLRKAWHCAISLFHLHDWVYKAHKAAIDANYTFVDDDGVTRPVSRASHFANALGQLHPDFQLIRGVANNAKHLEIGESPPGRQDPSGMPSHAANVYVTDIVFQPGVFQDNMVQTPDVMLEADPNHLTLARIAQSVMDMWNRLFQDRGW